MINYGIAHQQIIISDKVLIAAKIEQATLWAAIIKEIVVIIGIRRISMQNHFIVET